eukprot:6320554-Pyramimonas_sp.AAC.1
MGPRRRGRQHRGAGRRNKQQSCGWGERGRGGPTAPRDRGHKDDRGAGRTRWKRKEWEEIEPLVGN